MKNETINFKNTSLIILVVHRTTWIVDLKLYPEQETLTISQLYNYCSLELVSKNRNFNILKPL